MELLHEMSMMELFEVHTCFLSLTSDHAAFMFPNSNGIPQS